MEAVLLGCFVVVFYLRGPNGIFHIHSVIDASDTNIYVSFLHRFHSFDRGYKTFFLNCLHNTTTSCYVGSGVS